MGFKNTSTDPFHLDQNPGRVESGGSHNVFPRYINITLLVDLRNIEIEAPKGGSEDQVELRTRRIDAQAGSRSTAEGDEIAIQSFGL